jgi:hypothetical protein
MSVELLGRAAPNAQAFLLAWLAPLGACGTLRNPGDPLPFRMVTQIDGSGDLFSEWPLVSVHTFGDTAGDIPDTLAMRASSITHRRLMLLMDDPTTEVQMADGSIAGLEYFDVKELPKKVNYHDTSVIRYVGRYELGLKLV